METFANIIEVIDNVIWGSIIPGSPIPGILVLLLVPTGLWLTIRLGGVQFTRLGQALHLGLIKRKEDGDSEGDISHFQALTTALSATVGTGNIAGVATAIGVGGPGALFWMWITGLVGMATKYSEAFLGCRFRELDANGEQQGGPQIYLKQAIKGKGGVILASLFAIFAVIASFGIGNMTQINTISAAMQTTFSIPPLATGIFCAAFVGLVIIGGIKRIGSVTAALVPLMIVVYIVGGIIVLACNFTAIPDAFVLIFKDAFTGTAATGGFLGSGIALAIQKGISRGVFSNESGLGSAAIVAASAQSKHPVRQGLVSMTQTFIDTIIVVTFTGLVLITTGVWNGSNGGLDADGVLKTGSDLTSAAFQSSALGGIGDYLVTISVFFFAITTVIGWSYYGERSAVSLFGLKASMPFRAVFTLVCVTGALLSIEVAWNFADVANGLMALPNLIGLLLLSGLISRETKEYLKEHPKL